MTLAVASGSRDSKQQRLDVVVSPKSKRSKVVTARGEDDFEAQEPGPGDASHFRSNPEPSVELLSSSSDAELGDSSITEVPVDGRMRLRSSSKSPQEKTTSTGTGKQNKQNNKQLHLLQPPETTINQSQTQTSSQDSGIHVASESQQQQYHLVGSSSQASQHQPIMLPNHQPGAFYLVPAAHSGSSAPTATTEILLEGQSNEQQQQVNPVHAVTSDMRPVFPNDVFAFPQSAESFGFGELLGQLSQSPQFAKYANDHVTRTTILETIQANHLKVMGALEEIKFAISSLHINSLRQGSPTSSQTPILQMPSPVPMRLKDLLPCRSICAVISFSEKLATEPSVQKELLDRISEMSETTIVHTTMSLLLSDEVSCQYTFRGMGKDKKKESFSGSALHSYVTQGLRPKFEILSRQVRRLERLKEKSGDTTRSPKVDNNLLLGKINAAINVKLTEWLKHGPVRVTTR